jgi:hypothetical protein
MEFIRQFKKSLMQFLKKSSLKKRLILGELVVGICLTLIIGTIFNYALEGKYLFLSVLIGFIASFYLYTDMALYVFKKLEAKNINPSGIQFRLLRSLLLIFIFFIIIYNFLKLNFIAVFAGVSAVPFSMIIIWLFFSSIFINDINDL